MKKIFLMQVFILILSVEALCYETNVHRTITNQAVASSNISSYLKTNLNINLTDYFGNRRAQKWMEDGSDWEDNAPRWLNHFYDPTTGKGLGLGTPSLEWGKEASFNSYSWKEARDYFYKALTETSSESRENYFSDVFRSLGQIIHLIQDKAVPAHVRNDPHFPYVDTILHDKDMYEDYTRINEGSLKYDGYLSVYSNADNKTFNIFDAFWKNSGKGLAEFTNSNFFSRDTNKDNPEHKPEYSSPVVLAESQVFQEEVIDADGNKEVLPVRYGLGTVTDSYTDTSYTDVKLTAYSIWDFDYKKKEDGWVYSLNDTIHRTYAGFLIPRAVGYSAGLLNYFFRGEIDMVPDDATGSGYVIVNNTDEDMNGTFELWYDNNKDERAKVSGASWTLSINKKSSDNNKSINITFDTPTDAKEAGKYMLVFRGKLGNEEDAVAGKMVELEKDYLFLVNLKNQTIAFEIRLNNNQYQLIPASKNINITRFSMPSTLLTVQSHPNKKEHIVALPRTSLNQDGTVKHSTYNPTIGGYGGQYEDTWWEWMEWYTWKYPQVVRGFPNAYIPKDFKEGSPYVWDNSLINGEWLYKTQGYYTYWRLGSYIHGRRPFSIVNNKLVAKNINIRKNDAYTYSGSDFSGPFHIQYRDESGKWVRGIDLLHVGGEDTRRTQSLGIECKDEGGTHPYYKNTICFTVDGETYEETRPTFAEHHAILDEDKTIYTVSNILSEVKGISHGDIATSISGGSYREEWWPYCGDRSYVTISWGYTFKYTEMRHQSNYSAKTELIAGNDKIEEFEVTTTELGGSELQFFGVENAFESTSYSGSSCDRWYRISTTPLTSIYEIKGIISPYSLKRTGISLQRIMDYDHFDGDKYYIFIYEYREVDENETSTALITPLEYDQTDYEVLSHSKSHKNLTKYKLVYKINDVIEKIEIPVITTSFTDETTSTTTGYRITGVSSQINNTNMVYTYIVERYDNNKWVFDRHIISIINISDNALPIGYRQEFEITEANADSILGEYKDYNYKDLAAIGVHSD